MHTHPRTPRRHDRQAQGADRRAGGAGRGDVAGRVGPEPRCPDRGPCLQGAAGGILPLSIGIVRDELPKEKVGVTVGLLSAIFGVGAGIGIVAAGPIVENLSWHWLFWLPLVLVVIALLGVIFGMKESPVFTPGRLDVVGAGILTIALVSLLLAISKGQSWGWSDNSTISLLGVGAIALIGFVLFELHTKEPLIDVRLMKIRGVWSTDLIALILGFAMFGTFLLVPQLLQLPVATGFGFGESVSTAGLFLLPTVLMMIVFGPLAGLMDRRYGPKVPMILGTVLVTIGFLVPAISHGTVWMILLSGIFVGAGIGSAFAAMSNAIIESVPAAQTGEATGVNAIARTIGSSVGTAVIAAVLTTGASAQGLPTDQAFTNSFWICAAVAALAIVIALALPQPNRHRTETAARVEIAAAAVLHHEPAAGSGRHRAAEPSQT